MYVFINVKNRHFICFIPLLLSGKCILSICINFGAFSILKMSYKVIKVFKWGLNFRVLQIINRQHRQHKLYS